MSTTSPSARRNALSTDDEFVARHIGPSPSQIEAMLATIGVASLDELIDSGRPGFDPRFRTARAPRTGERARRDRRAAPARRQEPGAHEPDRNGIHEHDHAAGDRPQRLREPGVVHGVHAVPARDQPGPARGAAQLPDDDLRAHRARDRQRFAARRGDRGGRGDDDGASVGPWCGRSLLRAPRHPPADDRRAGDAGRTRRHRARRRRRRHAGRRRRGSAPSSASRPRLVRSPTGRRRSRRSMPLAAWRSSPPIYWPACSRRLPGSSAPTSSLVRRNASGCRWRSAGHTPDSSPPMRRRHGHSPAASSASAPTPWAGPHCGSHCRPGSNTSGASGRRRTSARRRYCSPTSPVSTRHGTAHPASNASPPVSTA